MTAATRSSFRPGSGQSTSSSRYRLRREIGNVFVFVLTVALALLFMFPFFWSISSSLKTPYEVIEFPPTLLPTIPHWENYAVAWNSADLGTFFLNSLFV